MTNDSPGFIRRCIHSLFGVYAWLVFGMAVLLAILVAVVIPGPERRHQCVAGIARAIFVLAGIEPKINGLDKIPEKHCMVVANHASYIDGVLLKAYLPARFSFVIKGEMRDIPIVHFMLRRTGSRFVERYQATGSTRDARTIVKAAQEGASLAIFPEGTFALRAGVGRFRPGAFVAAIKGGMPVIPIAILGTRSMMPSGRRLPRPVPITVEILQPIEPGDPAFGDNRTLAEAARQQILAVLDEPDLLEPDFVEK